MIAVVLARFPIETLVIVVVQYNSLYAQFFQTGIRHSHSPGKQSLASAQAMSVTHEATRSSRKRVKMRGGGHCNRHKLLIKVVLKSPEK